MSPGHPITCRALPLPCPRLAPTLSRTRACPARPWACSDGRPPHPRCRRASERVLVCSVPFQPNPRGLKGFFELKATIPQGTKVVVGAGGYNYWSGSRDVELGGEGQAGSTPAVIRIAEILSMQRLFYEGEQLFNCLRGSQSSQAKYLSRARARVSSFWSLTKQEKDQEVEHMCLIEVLCSS